MPHDVARQVDRRLTASTPGGIQGPEIKQRAENTMDCFSEAVRGSDCLQTIWQIIRVTGPAAKDFLLRGH